MKRKRPFDTHPEDANATSKRPSRRRGGSPNARASHGSAPAPGGPVVPGLRNFRLISRGGYGLVYKADEEDLDRVVAVKFLEVARADQKSFERFQRERQLTARLGKHPNIMTIFQAGMDQERPYMTMEYFPHGSLSDRLERDGVLSIQVALRLGVKLAGALETAHRAGIVHRDIKPENVLLDERDDPVLADFGISVLKASVSAGVTEEAFTRLHAAPEVVLSGAFSEASDIYSLASVLYTALEGRSPREETRELSVGEFVVRTQERRPTRPMTCEELPDSLRRILMRSLGHEPVTRHGSAAEFGEDLRRVQLELGLERTELTILRLNLPAPADASRAAGGASLPAGDGGETRAKPGRVGRGEQDDVPSSRETRRRKKVWVWAGLVIGSLGLMAAAIWLLVRGGSSGAREQYRETLVSVLDLAEETQADTDALNAIQDVRLAGERLTDANQRDAFTQFLVRLDSVEERLSELEASTTSIVDPDAEREIRNVIGTMLEYVAELERLTDERLLSLDQSNFTSLNQLDEEVESSIGVAEKELGVEVARPNFSIDPSPLETALLKAKSAWELYVDDAVQRDRRRLKNLTAFADEFEGKILEFRDVRDRFDALVTNLSTRSGRNAAPTDFIFIRGDCEEILEDLEDMTAPTPFEANLDRVRKAVGHEVLAEERAVSAVNAGGDPFDTPQWATYEQETSTSRDILDRAWPEYLARKRRVMKLLEREPLVNEDLSLSDLLGS